MDNKEKYEEWLDFVVYDLETADAMLVSGRYLYVGFVCQQAVEKLVKGLYVLYKGEKPPRTHNIWKIFNRTFATQTFDEQTPDKLEEYYSIFDELLAYYISERYHSYQSVLSQSITAERASEVLNKTKEVFSGLESLARLEL